MTTYAATERGRARLPVYGGLFFTTLSTLMYEVLLTRIFSVTMWYHFAFVAVSIALFGMTVGALAVYLAPRSFPQELTDLRLFQATLAFSVSIVASFVVHLFIPFDPKWSAEGVASAAAVYLVISVPFIFSGIAVCLALTRFPSQIGRLYAADLIGAALGTVTLIWLLDALADGPSAVVAIAALAAVGAASFAAAAGRELWMPMAVVIAAVFGVFAVVNAVMAQNGEPMLRILQAKGVSEDVPLYERWNAFSRIRVDGDPEATGFPVVYGRSPVCEYPGNVSQVALTIDATAATPLYRYSGNPQDMQFLRCDIVNFAHHVRRDARVLVIGVGGGRDILSALAFRQREVTAVEMNGAILDAVNGEFGDFTGHLDRLPNVELVNDEARSYLERTDDEFDIIQISLIDTWAATAAGAFALSENGLYTAEAWDLFLDRLSERGMLTVSRWYMLGEPMEAYRMASLAGEALRRNGYEEPERHFVMLHSGSSVFPGIATGTMLLSREPLSADDLRAIQQWAAAFQFDIAYLPGGGGTQPLFGEILRAEDPTQVDLPLPVDISAPTDDRPFFFQMVGFSDVFNDSLYGGLNDYLARPVLVLFSLAIAVLALTALFIIGPIAVTTSRQALQGSLPFVFFFAGIGLGFLLLEIAQLQRLIIFLGHPTYALSVVLFALLLSSGVGSLLTERLVRPSGNPGFHLGHLWPLGALLAVLALFAFVTPAVVDAFDSSTTPVRIAASVGVLVPMGLLMGMPFPLGMTVASMRPNSPTAFFWGINGATSVCASVFAVVIAMGWGISSTFWVGIACYAVATAALGLAVVRLRASTGAGQGAPVPVPVSAGE